MKTSLHEKFGHDDVTIKDSCHASHFEDHCQDHGGLPGTVSVNLGKGIVWLFIFANAMVLSPIVQGWIICKLWTWFIVPTFALPVLSIPVAIGIAVIASVIRGTTPSSKEEEDFSTAKVLSRSIAHRLVIPFMSLAFGWAVHLFI